MDRGEQVIVGANKYRLEAEDPIGVRDIDKVAVRVAQLKRLEGVRRRQDPAEVARSLELLSESASTGSGSLVEATVAAARARATVGEISNALRRVFGEHVAIPEVVNDIYGAASATDRNSRPSSRGSTSMWPRLAGDRSS